MNYGYPGANTKFDSQNVSEESFWPSFADIMMVIVMVFLLVTVAVILNNWALISKLTTSIEAQKVAASLADNRQIKNLNLEHKLSDSQQRLQSLNQQFDKEKAALEQTQDKLSSAAQALLLKEQSLASIENKLSALNEQYEADKLRLSNTSQQLFDSEQQLSDTDKQLLDAKQQLANKISIIDTLDNKLLAVAAQNKELQTSLDETQQKLVLAEEKNTSFEASTKELQANLSKLEQEKQSLESLSEEQKTELEEKTQAQIELEKQLTASKAKLVELAQDQTSKSEQILTLQSSVDENLEMARALQTDRNLMDEKLAELLAKVNLAEKTLAQNQTAAMQEKNKLQAKVEGLIEKLEAQTLSLKDNEAQKTTLQAQLDKRISQVTKLQTTLSESKKTALSIEETVIKSENALKSLEQLFSESQKTIAQRDATIQQLTAAQKEGNEQLISLQGEYDNLDTKYQKLLRPARSLKGKYVATVVYKKLGGKHVIRFKSSPNGSYRTISKGELGKRLTVLKKKHKKQLYVKVVIPKNSGLSYNEAWRFTINLQRKYDYYYN